MKPSKVEATEGQAWKHLGCFLQTFGDFSQSRLMQITTSSAALVQFGAPPKTDSPPTHRSTADSMPDLVAKKVGGKVLMVSSLDENHPGDNMIDGREDSYWISTGLYPQEILLQLSQRSQVSNVKISATNVRGIRISAFSDLLKHRASAVCLIYLPQTVVELTSPIGEFQVGTTWNNHQAHSADIHWRFFQLVKVQNGVPEHCGP